MTWKLTLSRLSQALKSQSQPGLSQYQKPNIVDPVAEKSNKQKLKEQRARLPELEKIVEAKRAKLSQAQGALQSATIERDSCKTAIEILEQQVN